MKTEKRIGKLDIIKAVAPKVGLSQEKVNAVIDEIQNVIVTEVMDNNADVNLPKLGTFKLKINPARKGINPLNKKPMDVPESHTISFKPTAGIKKVIEAPKTKKAKK